MTILPSLPPNLTQAQLQEVLNDRIRELNQLLASVLTSPMTIDLDMGSHRILALNDPQGDLDAVNLRTLKRFQSPAAPPPPPAAAPLSRAYAMVFDKTAALVDGELIPAYTVGKDRTGGPEEAWLVSRAAAPADIKINFGVILPPPHSATPIVLLVNKKPDANGKINPLDLVLPAGQKGPVFFVDGGPIRIDSPPTVPGFAVTNFPHGTVVYPLIDQGSAATLCSMGVVVH